MFINRIIKTKQNNNILVKANKPIKSQGRIPRVEEQKKDVIGCEKFWSGANSHYEPEIS